MSTTESTVESIMSHPWCYGGLPIRNQGDLLLCFSSNYSLGVWSTWSVYSDGLRCFVRRIEWARGRDRILIAGEAPSTFGAESEAPVSLASHLLGEASSLVASSLKPEVPGITIDGTQRKLTFGADGGTAYALTWQAGSPHAAALDAWLEASAQVLDELLPSSSAREAQRAASQVVHPK